MKSAVELEKRIVAASNTLLAVAPHLPSLESLSTELADAERAQSRGYFLPDEDERVRSQFAKYLHIRASLKATLWELTPLLIGRQRVPADMQHHVFAVAFCAACLMVRSARFILDNFRDKRVVWRKLDEAEPNYGIPRKRFTRIYRSLTSPRNVWLFRSGLKYQQDHAVELKALATDSVVGPVIEILDSEQEFIESSLLYFAKGRLLYRWHSFLRRHHSGFKNVTFALFKWSGSLIAEMRDKRKPKRVTAEVRARLATELRPGDVIVTRHDDATSNLFLPGFWPHGALYVGTELQRRELGISMPADQAARGRDPACVLEARKDGVLLRELNDTLDVDCCAVIRPQLSAENIREGIARALAHEGKSYDFEFDFRRSDKLVCTEVTYRAFHGIGGIEFELRPRAGRMCLSAEDLLDAAVDGPFFDVVAVFGVAAGGAADDRVVIGPDAEPVLRASYRVDS